MTKTHVQILARICRAAEEVAMGRGGQELAAKKLAEKLDKPTHAGIFKHHLQHPKSVRIAPAPPHCASTSARVTLTPALTLYLNPNATPALTLTTWHR